MDGVDAHLEQLKRDLAWHYKAHEREQTPLDRLDYAAAEKDAAASRLGLWQDAEPGPPWDWRQPNKLNT